VKTIRLAVVAIAVAGLLLAGTQFRRTFTRWIMPVVHASGGCSNSSLRGSFGFQFNGTVLGVGPIAGVGVNTYDGVGSYTGTQTVNINGFPVPNQPTSGTYSVNADCTGTQTVSFPGGQVVHLAFVLVGKQAYGLQMDPGVVLTNISSPVGPLEQD
jgi:hypothetical protein